ncbi:MAG: efflux RND transporter periplasmic adaptor subunit [Deltaproteobacteria bacterium]|jgi:membrane fusion protein, multidrug efflux system
MKPGIKTFVSLAIAAVLLVLALWFLRIFGGAKPEKAGREVQGPVASVRIAPVREGVLTAYITSYGSVIPAPGALQSVSVPFESQIVQIMVSNGQKVNRGNSLIEIKPSPDTRLQLEQAQQNLETARQTLKDVEGRFALKLATNDQILKAKLNLRQAQLRVKSMKKRGIGPPRTLTAPVKGLIKKVYVQEGAIVGAGQPLAEVVTQDRLEVRLGVEPDDIARVKDRQPVTITRVNVPALAPVTGHVRKVSYGVNPNTRLVDVFVSLPSTASFLLDESVAGKIAVARARGLIVPRSAALPAGHGSYSLFTIHQGRAVKHTVRIILQNDQEVELQDGGLKVGDSVVTVGNYELKDGVAVKVQETP